jgi:hypothetical protein
MCKGMERVTLKSHMKYKPERVSELKKAVARYLSRANTGVSQLPTLTGDVSMANPEEDLMYESDFHDDMA